MPDFLLLPGLGADGRLFQRLAGALPDSIVTPPWPLPRRDESLAGFARRLAADLPGDMPGVIGGASFGGMVALELAALTGARTVVLLGSCTHPDAIAPPLRSFCRMLSRAPERAFRPRPWLSPLVLPLFGPLRSAERRMLWEMAAMVEPGFLKWGLRAILAWQPAAQRASIFHLHGSADRIIPISRVHPTHVVHGAGHVPSLSHPVQTSEFLANVRDETG